MARGRRCSCCGDAYLNKGPWMPEEDELLVAYIRAHGHRGNWRKLPKEAGLSRCGKSCRLRWLNHLRPDLKRGSFSEDEEELIIRLHSLLGNRWSLIAGRVPGRSDNNIKNYWNFHLSKKLLSMGIDPKAHKPLKRSSYLRFDDSESPRRASTSAEDSPSLEQDYNFLAMESTEISNSSSADEQRQLDSSGNSFYSRNSSFSSVTSSLPFQGDELGTTSPNTSASEDWIHSKEWEDSFQVENEMVEHNHNLTTHEVEADLFTEEQQEQGQGGLSDLDFLQDPSLELDGLLEILEGL